MGRTEEEKVNRYAYYLAPSSAQFPPISKAESMELFESYMRFKEVKPTKVVLALHVHFVSVFKFEGISLEDQGEMSGWVIGGRMPHLMLNDDEISTPMEALAIYVLYERNWLDAKGIDEPPGSIPDYRMPPDWHLLSYFNELSQLKIGALMAFVQWNLIELNKEHVLHPEIRQHCVSRGYIGGSPITEDRKKLIIYE